MSTDQPEQGETAKAAPVAAATAPGGETGSAARAEPPPPVPPPSVPWWRRLWGTLHSRFARQLAMVAVVAGGIAAVGHFVGGILGWWHAYEFAFGPKHGTQTSGKVVQGTAEGHSMVVLPLTVSLVADTVVLPTPAEVASPCESSALLTLATALLEDAQVTCVVRSCVELSV